jgi:hypothetical protein
MKLYDSSHSPTIQCISFFINTFYNVTTGHTCVIYKLQNVQFTWCRRRRWNLQKALLRKVQRSRTDNIQLHRLILRQLSTLYESFYVHKRLGMQAKYTWPHSQQSSLHHHNDRKSGQSSKLSAPVNNLHQKYLHYVQKWLIMNSSCWTRFQVR